MVDPAPPAADDEPTWPEIRDHGTLPVSPRFVDDALARLHADEGVTWSRLLAHHRVPSPTADFVARTMVSLRAAPRPAAPAHAVAPRAARSAWRPWLVAAAVVIGGSIVFLAMPPRPGSPGAAPAAAWTHAHPVAAAFGRAVSPSLGDDFFSRVRFDDVDGLNLLADSK